MPQGMTRLHLALALGVLVGATSLSTVAFAKKKKPKPKPAPAPAALEFDRAAAAKELAAVDLSKCRATNAPRGQGHVTVLVAATGMA
jgi:hypothetical protein